MSDYDMRAHQICDFSEIISDIIVYEEVVPCCIAATVRIVPYIAVVIAVIEICLGALIDHPAVRTDHIVLDRRHCPALRSKDLNLGDSHPAGCIRLIQDPHCLYIGSASEVNCLIGCICKCSCFHPLI